MLHPEALQGLEKYRSNKTVLKKLADIFQCSIDELLGYCRPRTSHERWR